MTMDKNQNMAAKEVERCSKLGTQRLQEGFPEKALEAYRNAYKNALSLSQYGYMVRACAFNLGAMLISMENFIEGLAYLNKAVPPEGKRDGRSNGDLYFNYGLAYEGLKNVSKARQYYEVALKEYRAVNDNIKMETDIMSRVVKLCLENNLLSEADNWMQQLTSLYSNLEDVEKELQLRVERSNLLLKMGQAEEAEQVADECLQVLDNATPSVAFAKLYSDLSVAYTQILHYDKAVQCSEKALPLVEEPNGDPRLASVLYQNLGAIYNYMGRFEDAVKYHLKACNAFAKLQMRANQGHCFTNMGYAYSQMKDMDRAGECFLHGLQAARDCGDHKTEWQNLEALASVAFHKRSLKKAEQYYQQAISVLASSPEGQDPSVHERLITKLKHIIQAQTSRPISPVKDNLTHMVHRASLTQDQVKIQSQKNSFQKFAITANSSKNLKNQNDLLEKDLESLASHMASGDIKVIRKGSQVRYLKVRRSGTLRRFQKVALGLDVPMDDNLKEDENDGEDSSDEKEDMSSKDSSDKSEVDSNDEIEDETDKKPKQNDKEEEIKRMRAQSARPPDSYLPRDPKRNPLLSESNSENNGSVEHLPASEESDDDDDDEAQVKRLMKQQLSDGNEIEFGTSTKQVIKADIHDEPSSESSESESDESEQRNRQRFKPPVPDRSPETTIEKSLRTYENPVENPDQIYQTIDHKPPASKRTMEEVKVEGAEGNTGIYESLRPQLSRSPSKQAVVVDRDSDGNEISEDEMQKIPRGEREILLYREFQASKKQSKERDDTESEMGDQKSSKHCIVM